MIILAKIHSGIVQDLITDYRISSEVMESGQKF